MPNLGKGLIEPQCTLGPRELCTTLIPVITGCDGGDASDCIAVGQFLADTPPRAGFAMSFFAQACRIGDAAGCERVDELKSDASVPCETDPLACSLRAVRLQDRELHDDACSLGAALSCAHMVEFTKDDPATSRAYLATGCQLGEPVMCMELGHRLQPDCEASEVQLCYEPDPQEARAALEIACAAGWETTSVCDE